MKILVCISHVPDTTSKIAFTSDGSQLDKSGLQFVINPYDEFALSKALNLKETLGGSVTIITMGDVSVEQTMRKALAIGADDAIRLDAEPTDPIMVAKAIATAINDASYDLILCGQESIDYNGGIVPGALAALLNAPFVNACIRLEFDGSAITAIREIDGGKESVTANLPAVIAGKKGLVLESELRIPNMRGIMMARKKPLTVVSADDLEALSAAQSFKKPQAKAAVQLIDADDMESLVSKLHTDAKVI
ncbi:MAG: electron transfer flavoprotein beta subunit/FixA family protein [Bacteroidetes bacterium]|nr:electron transfer flavoprotein beta subunit/FixA family protein [Bacteroidota bacterium]